MSKAFTTVFLFTITLAACGASDEPEVGETEQSLSTYRRALFFSDATMTTMVGERSSLCTSTTNWGVRTEWVYNDSGSCEEQFNGPAEWPNGNSSCVCCYDTDGNGSCGNQDSPYFHICTNSYNCN